MERTPKNQIKCNDEYTCRTAKTTELQELNQSAWPDNFNTKRLSVKLLKEQNFSSNEGVEYTTSGRIRSIREHGKSVFITFSDSTDTMQTYTKNDEENNATYQYIKQYLDIGDIIEVEGTLFFTKTGEKTIRTNHIKLLSKCLHFIPDDYTGLENIEVRYRKRYLDILVNKNVKTIFEKRTYLIQHIRRFLDTHGYLEVETPMLHPIPGGALAKPFVTHHNALDTDLYLRIAPELYLKRMIVAGFDKVYEINKNFRNEGVSIRHNPEFTMLEFYTAFQDYNWAMNFVEEILKTSCFHLNQSYQTEWNSNIIDFSQPFDKLTAKDVIIKYTSITEADLSEKNIDILINDVQKKESLSYQEKIFYIFEEYAEKKVIKPTFLIDFPIELSPLAKANPSNPLLACRFELFICGMEIANGYNELNNPFEQAKRFKEQAAQKNNGNDEAMHLDAEFIHALEYGMPPTAGVGIGIDRLCMLLTEAKSIKDVILFPTMKRV